MAANTARKAAMSTTTTKKTKKKKAATAPEPALNGAARSARSETAAVSRYLTALEQPTRRRSPEVLQARHDDCVQRLAAATDPLERLDLIVRRNDLAARLAEPADDGSVEEEFVAVAAAYSQRKGISWPAWREVGVPAEVLRRAGVPRS